jgi:hypothetical protein
MSRLKYSGDLIGKLDVLRIKCATCGRSGRCHTGDRELDAPGRLGAFMGLAAPPSRASSAEIRCTAAIHATERTGGAGWKIRGIIERVEAQGKLSVVRLPSTSFEDSA